MAHVETICPKCGNFYYKADAVCAYCGYIGVVPLNQQERSRYDEIRKLHHSGLSYSEGLKKAYNYLDELREKYQFKQGEAYDETLWNNRQKKMK